ncbi:MAG: YciI family protein [Fimbriimonas sp.]
MKFLVSAHLPDDYQPSAEDAELGPQIHAFNAKMEAAGALFFACGLMPASLAKVARPSADGKVLVTDGPYLETKEHIGGFYILDAASEEEALEWAREGAAVAKRAIEVRQIFFQEE